MGKTIVTVGIDPGKEGAAALMQNGKPVDLIDWVDGPTVARQFHMWADLYAIDLVILERVHAMPRQGGVSQFSFGNNYGWWQGFLDGARLPYAEVLPTVWQKNNFIPRKNSQSDKPSLTVARRLWPDAPLNWPGIIIALMRFLSRFTHIQL